MIKKEFDPFYFPPSPQLLISCQYQPIIVLVAYHKLALLELVTSQSIQIHLVLGLQDRVSDGVSMDEQKWRS
jgi:hypothetical protein